MTHPAFNSHIVKFSTLARLACTGHSTISQPAISDLSKGITVVATIASHSTPVDTQERRISLVVPSGPVRAEEGSP